uniref:PiggyBac transposable element-derived protein domain-containing protein n=1 Tax=Arion vulgaris TaxID=1028688 RepID=A0A0B7B5W3_9EUPU
MSFRTQRLLTAEQVTGMFQRSRQHDKDFTDSESVDEFSTSSGSSIVLTDNESLDSDCEGVCPLISTVSGSTSSTSRPTQVKHAQSTVPVSILTHASTSTSTRMTADSEWVWNEVGLSPQNRTENLFRFNPSRTPGISAPLYDESSALKCFQTILTDTVIDNLIISINDYAVFKINEKIAKGGIKKQSVYASWVPINREEINRFLALLIVMGLNRRPRIRDYWTKTPTFWYSPFVFQVFPNRSRFEAIYHTMLHAGEPGAESKHKIEPFLNAMVGSFQDAFYPFQNLSIDEMVIGFKGRWKYKQFNASKPHKHHIKSFGLCDSATGYVYNILLYFGKETSYAPDVDKDGLQAVKVFQTLLKNIEKGHTIFADRYYTALPVITYLLDREIYFTGTVMSNRKKLPQGLKDLKLKHRESKWFLDEAKRVMCVAWRDKKAKKHCVLASSLASAENVVGNDKPFVIDCYNQSMNGCDKADQNIAYYCNFERRSKKWWKKIFFWLFEIAQYNSFILYKLSHLDEQKTGFRDFKSMLVQQLLEHTAPLRMEITISDPLRCNVYSESAMHLVEYITKDRKCLVCSTPAKLKRTNFICSGCTDRPHLHPKTCFAFYHQVKLQSQARIAT